MPIGERGIFPHRAGPDYGLLLDGDSKGVSLNATADLPSMDGGAASNGQQFAKENELSSPILAFQLRQ